MFANNNISSCKSTQLSTIEASTSSSSGANASSSSFSTLHSLVFSHHHLLPSHHPAQKNILFQLHHISLQADKTRDFRDYPRRQVARQQAYAMDAGAQPHGDFELYRNSMYGMRRNKEC